MKSKEEIEQLAFLKYPRLINDPYNPMEDDNADERKIWIDGYNQCQKDMSRKEIQPEDIWNKESQDKIKEHILNRANNQSSEDIIETELAAKKYAEEDMLKILQEEIKKAFMHGQVNAQMMEIGLERNEVEDYTNSRMLSFTNIKKTNE